MMVEGAADAVVRRFLKQVDRQWVGLAELALSSADPVAAITEFFKSDEATVKAWLSTSGLHRCGAPRRRGGQCLLRVNQLPHLDPHAWRQTHNLRCKRHREVGPPA